MQPYVEHANLRVGDIDAAIRFFQTAMPEFAVRKDVRYENGHRWVHLGTETSYLTLNTAPKAPEPITRPPKGVSHVGFVVENAEALRDRMLAAGYKEGYVSETHPHRRRVYILDDDGMEWEFVQYYSDNIAERNDYSDV
jgi:catechol 2,3-dioxygenase-like lactoylglutathione lyase family enzyme